MLILMHPPCWSLHLCLSISKYKRNKYMHFRNNFWLYDNKGETYTIMEENDWFSRLCMYKAFVNTVPSRRVILHCYLFFFYLAYITPLITNISHSRPRETFFTYCLGFQDYSFYSENIKIFVWLFTLLDVYSLLWLGYDCKSK